MGLIEKELDNLKECDLWSMLLFVLFKLKDSPEYSTLSELCIILDKSNFLKLCEYFGGMTITLPTVDDLDILLNALIVYKYVDLDKKCLDEVLDSIDKRKHNDLLTVYNKMKDVLKNYSFSSRG